MREAVTFDYMKKDKCCGCEACVSVCPTNAIYMEADSKGFLYPVVDEDKCISCNKCVRYCPQIDKINDNSSMISKVYAGFATKDEIVASSSSGGIFTLLSEMFFEEYPEGKVAAVVWSDDYRKTIHVLGGKERLEDMKRSKYIQSNKGNIYREVKNLLDADSAVMFVGCPCEVAALATFLGKEYEKLLLVDLVCQGPTSPKVMDDYVSLLEKKHSAQIESINLRYNGGKTWIPQWINVKFSNGKIFKRVFYETELGIAVHFMQRSSCYSCEWNGSRRKSDITLGDYHGADVTKKYYNAKGTSIVIVNSNKGNQLLTNLRDRGCYLEEVSYEEVAKHNPRIEKAWEPLQGAESYMEQYEKNGLKKASYRALGIKKKIKYFLPTWLSNIVNR